eukprot:m.44943 g.44943  ORF g.44943 m.44943 type:complete len:251 (-) comp13060_c0_seq1:94-846(-)
MSRPEGAPSSAAVPSSNDDTDFLYYVVYRDNATQTCPSCDMQSNELCICRPDDPNLEQPSTLLYLRDASGAILGVAVMAALDVGGRVVRGAIYAATNASIGLVIAGIRGAIAGIATGIFWTGVSLLQFGVSSTIALGTAAASVLGSRGKASATPLEPDVHVEEVQPRHRCSTGVQTEGMYLPTMANGIPVAVLPTLQQSLHASTMPAHTLPPPEAAREPVPYSIGVSEQPTPPRDRVAGNRAVQPSAPAM